ncbi:MAG: chemotaxis protein CheW [Nitrospirae bacterium]|nr:chemotaxis protein CheW [Nitrospirota bacterium]
MSAMAATAEDILQLVTMRIGNEEYAVDIIRVQEINRMRDITRVPNSPPYVEGVINLRGKVIPVVNLRKKFSLPEVQSDGRSRIIIMDIKGITMGVIVDSVSEVLRVSPDTVESAPPMASDISADFFKGIAKLEDRLIILIDIDRLLGNGKAGHAAMLGSN